MKLFKKFSLLCLVLSLILGVCAVFAACDPKDDQGKQNEDEVKTVDYEITVTCESAPSILATVQVDLLKSDGTPANDKSVALKDGKATFALPAGEYTVSLKGALDNYEYPETKVNAQNPKATVALTVKKDKEPDEDADKIDYSVTVLYPNEEPVVGVHVQLCISEENCSSPKPTDENGVATLKLLPATYAVHLIESTVPDGYTFDNELYTMDENGGSLTVHLEAIDLTEYKVLVVDGDNGNAPLTGVKVALYRQWYDDDYVQHVETQPADVQATGSDGIATLHAAADVYVVGLLDVPADWGFETTILVEAAKPDLIDTPFVVHKLGSDAYYTLPLKEGANTVSIEAGKGNTGIWYSFVPETDKAGEYKITSSGSNDVDVNAYRYSGAQGGFINTFVPEASDEQNGEFSLSFVITDQECAEDAHNIWVFKFVALTDDAMSFTVTLTFVKPYVAPTEHLVTAEAKQTKSEKYVQPADTTWVWLTPNDNIVKGSDGNYHYGTESGPVVLAAIGSAAIPQGFDKSFPAGLAENGNDIKWSTAIDDNNEYKTYQMGDFFLAYIEAANDSGMHLLTDELALAMQKYAVMNQIYNTLGWDGSSDKLYAFICGYYKSVYETPASGNGSEDDAYSLHALGKYKFSMHSGDTLWFIVRSAGVVSFETDGVTLSAGGDSYTKGQPFSFEQDTTGTKFSFTASADVDLVFVLAEELGSEHNPYVWNVGAEGNTVSIPENKLYDGVWCSVTVNSTGLYTFSTTSANAVLNEVNYLIELNGDSSATMELIGGKTYLFVCNVADAAGNYTVTVVKAADVTPSAGTGTDSAPYELTQDGWYEVSTDVLGEGKYFVVNAKTAGSWKITVYNPAASVLVYGSSLQNEGYVKTLGDDELSFDIAIELQDRESCYLYMGAAEETSATYYFYFSAAEESEPAEGDLVIGTNTITITNADLDMGLLKTFIAPGAGTYVFTISSTNAYIAHETDSGAETFLDGDVGPMTVEVTMSAGETLNLIFSTIDFSGDTYTLTIAKQ